MNILNDSEGLVLFDVGLVNVEGVAVGLAEVDYPYANGMYEGVCGTVAYRTDQDIPRYEESFGNVTYVNGFGALLSKEYAADMYNYTAALARMREHLAGFIPELKDPNLRLVASSISTVTIELGHNIAVLW